LPFLTDGVKRFSPLQRDYKLPPVVLKLRLPNA
jgi:hypothetical protein